MTQPPAPQRPPPLAVAALDDDADFREFLRGVLGADGHDVRVCDTPAALFAACEQRLPELVLLDMKMGEHQGEAVLADLRRRWPRLAVIVVTGYPSLDGMRQTFRQEAADYLPKPFSLGELRATLAHVAASRGLGQRPEDRLRAELGRQVRVARVERGWTLKDLSEAAGLSVSQLSSIERGAAMPSLESLVAVAGALGVRPSAWLAGAGL